MCETWCIRCMGPLCPSCASHPDYDTMWQLCGICTPGSSVGWIERDEEADIATGEIAEKREERCVNLSNDRLLLWGDPRGRSRQNSVAGSSGSLDHTRDAGVHGPSPLAQGGRDYVHPGPAHTEGHDAARDGPTNEETDRGASGFDELLNWAEQEANDRSPAASTLASTLIGHSTNTTSTLSSSASTVPLLTPYPPLPVGPIDEGASSSGVPCQGPPQWSGEVSAATYFGMYYDPQCGECGAPSFSWCRRCGQPLCPTCVGEVESGSTSTVLEEVRGTCFVCASEVKCYVLHREVCLSVVGSNPARISWLTGINYGTTMEDIMYILRLDPAHCRFVIGGRAMRRRSSIADYNATDGTVLRIIGRDRGGNSKYFARPDGGGDRPLPHFVTAAVVNMSGSGRGLGSLHSEGAGGGWLPGPSLWLAHECRAGRDQVVGPEHHAAPCGGLTASGLFEAMLSWACHRRAVGSDGPRHRSISSGEWAVSLTAFLRGLAGERTRPV